MVVTDSELRDQSQTAFTSSTWRQMTTFYRCNGMDT